MNMKTKKKYFDEWVEINPDGSFTPLSAIREAREKSIWHEGFRAGLAEAERRVSGWKPWIPRS